MSVSNKFTDFRTGITALDSGSPTTQSKGANFAGFDIGMFQIIPSSGANPDVEVMSWSPKAGKFISANPVATASGAGVDVPYEITVPAYGRTFWVKVSGGAIGSIDIQVSGRRTGDIS